MVSDYKGRRWLRLITADIGSGTCANRVVVDTSIAHIDAYNRVSIRCQAETKVPGLRKAIKRTRNVDPFRINFSCSFERRGNTFRLSCAITSDELERHFVNNIDLFIASGDAFLVFLFFFFFFLPASSIIITLLRASARGGIWITTANNSARFS